LQHTASGRSRHGNPQDRARRRRPADDAALLDVSLDPGDMTRSRAIVALWIALVTTVLAASTLRLTGVLRGDTLDYVLGLAGLCVSFSTLGALILIRQPGNRMGLLFLSLACNEMVVV